VLGRLADRTSPERNAALGLAVALAGWVVFAWGSSVGALVAGVVLLDVGVQGAHVSNLARVHARRPEARSRMNTIYMVSYFAGGAGGTALGTFAWTRAGWAGVCAAGAASLAAALLVWGAARRRTR
jgi:predicted MFS family arabinose efflux permease